MTQLNAEAALQRVLQRLDQLECRLQAPCMPGDGEVLAAEIQLRQMRNSVFPSDYFPDPMWTLLLDLFLASFTGGGRTEQQLDQRLRLDAAQLQRLIERLIDDGYAELHRPEPNAQTLLRLTRLGRATLEAVFARTQSRIVELRAAA